MRSVVVCDRCSEVYRDDMVIDGEPCPKVNCDGLLVGEPSTRFVTVPDRSEPDA